jgi:hypothetical protein
VFGLPSDVQNELNAIFNRTPDVNQATQLALAYVRGTPWYAQEYPGIQEGIARGVVRNEQDYRAFRNSFSPIYQQYAGRDITPAEFAGYLLSGLSAGAVGQRFQDRAAFNLVQHQYGRGDITDAEFADYQRNGVTPDLVGRRFQGASIASVYGNDWQYAEGNFGEGRLTDQEKTAFGQQSAGIDSEIGLRVQRRLQMANERIKSVFSGTLATSQLKVPSLSQQADQPDIGR